MKYFLPLLFLLISTLLNAQLKATATTNSIQGKVIDEETQEPVPFAMVYLKENKHKAVTLTDIDGMFTLKIPSDEIKEKILFEISLVGYDAFQFTIKKKKLPVKNLKLKLRQSKFLENSFINSKDKHFLTSDAPYRYYTL